MYEHKINKALYSKQLKPAFTSYKKAIVFESSKFFIPYLHVVLLSLLDHISCTNKYDIIILTHEIDTDDCRNLLQLVKKLDNVQLRFFDPTEFVRSYIEKSRYEYLDINYYRMALPWILSEYDVALNLGADIVINKDINDLFKHAEIENKYLAGVIDLGYLGRLNLDIPVEELSLKNSEGYVNADVLVFNLKKIRRDFSKENVMNIWQKYQFRCAEQDALNVLFDGQIQHLDLKWNLFPDHMSSVKHIMLNKPEKIKRWREALKEPFIIHYAAYPKPWDYPGVGFGYIWWQYARQSIYYEEIIRRMCLFNVKSTYFEKQIWIRRYGNVIFPIGSSRRKFLNLIFPKNSRQREFIKKIYYTFFTNPNKEWNKKFGKMR